MLHWVVILVAFVASSLQMTTTAGLDRITALSNEEEIKIRFESYPGTNAETNWTARGISGPDLNEYSNVRYTEEEPSEFRVVREEKRTTCPCGRVNEGSTRVINGKETFESKYPFMVSLRTPERGHICGGSIITPIHILTAAHCVSDSRTIAVVGAHHRMIDASHGQTQKLKIKEVFTPDDWLPPSGTSGDIAILLLKTPIEFSKFVSPVCLTPILPEITKTSSYIVMGWGVSNIYHGYEVNPNNLLEANVQVMDKAMCSNEKGIICFKPGKKTSCNGDSGGPYVYTDPETNCYTQVALVSHKHFPPTHANCVGHVSHETNVVYWYHWIESIIQSTSSRYNICKKADFFQ